MGDVDQPPEARNVIPHPRYLPRQTMMEPLQSCLYGRRMDDRDTSVSLKFSLFLTKAIECIQKRMYVPQLQDPGELSRQNTKPEYPPE